MSGRNPTPTSSSPRLKPSKRKWVAGMSSWSLRKPISRCPFAASSRTAVNAPPTSSGTTEGIDGSSVVASTSTAAVRRSEAGNVTCRW